jgi:hypothetical protein
MLNFVFDRLETGMPPAEQTQAGVSVHLREFKATEERWKISLVLKHPSGEPEFESFESWLSTTQVVLQQRKGKQRLAPVGYEISQQPGRQVLLTYYFVGEKGAAPDRPEDWKLSCRTPGRIERISVPFEFKDVPLP